MIELRHLRYFIAVAEELHFSRAALRLNISQPPLSQQIRQLEEVIGAQLFVRNKRSVSLTNAGRDLYEHVFPWIEELNEMSARARLISEGERGSITVGCSYTTSHHLVPHAVRTFVQRFPTVTLKLLESPYERQVDALVRGFVDVAIIRLPVSHSELVFKELYEEPLVVVLPKGHRLAGRSKLRLLDLKQESFLSSSRRPLGLFDSMIAICEHAGFTPKLLDISSSANSAVALVGAGLGVTLVPAAIRYSSYKNVIYRAVSDSPRSMVGVVWRRGNSSSITQLFIDVASEVAAGGLSAN